MRGTSHRRSHRRRHVAATAAALAAALVLSGCGSTVQVDETTATTAGDGSLTQPLSGATQSVVPGADGTVPGVDPVDGGGVPGAGAGGGVPGPGGTTVPAGGTDGDGGGDDGDGGLDSVSETDDIEIGVPYTADSGEANAALGAGGITTGDEKANSQAVIDEINATGGIAGRKLKPVFFEYSATSSDTRANQDQAACSAFTEDNHIAVLMGSGLTETFDSCMASHGVLMIASGQIIFHDKAYLAKYRNLIQAGTMTQDRMMADQVSTLKRLDYFSGWNAQLGAPSPGAKPKIGILSIDLPTWERPLRSVFLPGLASAGYAVDPANVYAVRSAGTTGELAGTVADVQNATLRFISSGVTHVIILDASATVAILFAQAARQQRYLPRWGINSGSGAQVLYSQGVLTADQLAGAVGLGWEPTLDVPPSVSAKYNTPATTSCLALMKRRTGQTYTSTNAAGLALSTCDQGFLLQRALGKFTGTLSLSGAIAAVEKVGGGFDSALIHQTLLSASRHDALQTGFDMKWDSGCSCIQYVDSHTIR